MTRRWTGGVAATVLLLALGTGCGEEIEPEQWPHADCPRATSGPLAIVLGVRQNSPTPLLPQGIEELIVGAADSGEPIVVVPVDGEPTLEVDARFASGAGNEVAREDDLVTFVENVHVAMSKVRADTPEADPLAALTIAARAAGEGGTVLMLDSGLQTTDPLDFRQAGLLDADPADVTGYLKDSGLLPDLTRRSVVFGGLGDVAEPQPSLEGRRQNLIAIWTAIAERGNAGCVQVLDEPNPGQAPQDLPPVGIVSVPEVETPVLTQKPDATQECTETVLRDAGNVKFVADHADFRDPAAVRDHLRDLAGQIKKQGLQADLVGTTSSWGSEQGRLRLSRQRAKAVKRVLVDLGVPAERLTARGAGARWRGHVDDRGPGGELLPGPAALNRSVVIRVGC